MARPLALLSFAFLAAVATCACSSSSSSNGATTDSSPAGDVGADAHDSNFPSFDTGGGGDTTPLDDTTPADGADAGCTSITNIALEAVENDVASALPAGSGGLIADGTYVVTAVTKYTGPGGKTGTGTYRVTETARITGGVAIDGVRKVGDTPGYTYTAKIAPHADGTMQWKQTCPDAPGITYHFDAGTDSFTVYDTTTKMGITYTLKLHVPGP